MGFPQMLDSGPVLLIKGAVASKAGAMGKNPPWKELGGAVESCCLCPGL